MAKLVSKQQRLVMRVMNPQSGYSRVISCMASPKTLGGIDYGYTIVVGQAVRLIGLRLFFLPMFPDTPFQTTFKVVTGTTAPSNQQEIRAWDSVLPLTWRGTGEDLWIHYRGKHTYEWTMNRLYTGEGRRFGIWAQVNWDTVDHVYASFEISEG